MSITIIELFFGTPEFLLSGVVSVVFGVLLSVICSSLLLQALRGNTNQLLLQGGGILFIVVSFLLFSGFSSFVSIPVHLAQLLVGTSVRVIPSYVVTIDIGIIFCTVAFLLLFLLAINLLVPEFPGLAMMPRHLLKKQICSRRGAPLTEDANMRTVNDSLRSPFDLWSLPENYKEQKAERFAEKARALREQKKIGNC